jgi:hypothetical protein
MQKGKSNNRGNKIDKYFTKRGNNFDTLLGTFSNGEMSERGAFWCCWLEKG